MTIPLWRNPEAPVGERLDDLLSALTLEEKISLLDDNAPTLPRIGLPKFQYGGEALHGLCNTGRCTTFPMSIGLAATFDAALVKKIGAATGDEMRAKFHSPVWSNSPKVSLFVWSPVINILRDPRWGRSQETHGEDPFLTGLMGAAYARGLRGDHPIELIAAHHAPVQAVVAASGPPLRHKFVVYAPPTRAVPE